MIEGLAMEIYWEIARRFPICAASDEFYYFPQLLPAERDWRRWDDYSEMAVDEFTERLTAWEKRLADGEGLLESAGDRVDARALRGALVTLGEQLSSIGSHRTQPSYPLTIVGIGLAEAIGSGNPDALAERTAGT